VSGRKQTIFIPDYYRDEKYFVFLSLGDVPHSDALQHQPTRKKAK